MGTTPPGNPLSAVRELVSANFRSFAQASGSGGLLLVGCTVLALAWANSPWAESYHRLWHVTVGVAYGSTSTAFTLHELINDGLMALFFFLVGLEIKRELLVGELSRSRHALFPIIAALGGMLVPAAIYLLTNPAGTAQRGWGIPMATDIAFALAILSLLGPRVPLGLKVFLAALAIVDDLGAVVVIALFYSERIAWNYLAIAAALLTLALLLSFAGVKRGLVYGSIGVLLWLAVLNSGVHATVAGVLMALVIPARSRIVTGVFVEIGKRTLSRLERLLRSADIRDDDSINPEEVHGSIRELEIACEEAQPPLQRIEHTLQPLVSFGIMPIFALANAGVPLGSGFVDALSSPISIGVILGLVLGKQLGVTFFALLAVRLKLAALPEGVDWRQIYGVSWLCGIGFTMSMFIANLAFGEGVELAHAKAGILLGSGAAGLVGYLLLLRQLKAAPAATPPAKPA